MRFPLALTIFLCAFTSAMGQILSPVVDSIPMRDGKKLAADIYLPSSCVECPVVLIQTPYNRLLYRLGLPLDVGTGLDTSDFAFVIVDWRGFFGSGNAQDPDAKRGEDGYDCVEWIAGQNWSNGKIGTWGPSALGNVQFETAKEQPPHLVCGVPLVTGPQFFYEDYYPGGVYRTEYLEQLDGLGFGLSAIVLANPYYNLTWQVAENLTFYPEEIATPMFMIGGWYDHNIAQMLNWYQELKLSSPQPARDQHKILIGPWTHGGNSTSHPGSDLQGELSYPTAVNWNDSLAIRFLRFHLLNENNGWENEPNIRYFHMGKDLWETSNNWPIAPDIDTLFLSDGRSLQTNMTSAGQATLLADPRDPSPTHGGTTLRLDQLQGPYDQTDTVESRDDVIAFSTSVLTESLAVLGSIDVQLNISCDQKDTDVAVRLTDVYPDGRSMLLTDGIQRMRFRNGFSASDTAAMQTGEVYPITIALPPLVHTFLPGHQLRLLISGSNYPKYDVNLNNGGTMYVAGDSLSAAITIHYGQMYPSFLRLPTDVSLSAESHSNTLPVRVFPNPCESFFWVSLPYVNLQNTTYELHDLAGRLCIFGHFDSREQYIDVANLEHGLYLLKIEQNGEEVVQKLVVQ